MQLMGVTWAAFDHLLETFEPLLQARWNEGRKLNPRGSGRKRLLNAMDVLGLTLSWIHVPTFHIMLMLVFGIGPTLISTYLKDRRKSLLVECAGSTAVEFLPPCHPQHRK